MFVTTLDQDDITWLAFAAGIAAGSGNQAAHSALFGIISRIQVDLPGETPYGVAQADSEDFEGTTDPRFIPPLPSPPMNRQEDFGPGPIKGTLS